MNNKRSINLEMVSIYMLSLSRKSIVYRISGIGVLTFAVFLMYGFKLAFIPEVNYQDTKVLFEKSIDAKIIALVLLSTMIYLSCTKIKYLFMGASCFDYFMSKLLTSKISLIITAVVVFLAGVWGW